MARALEGGHHVAVSGASSGIGRAIALRLARGGARLSLFARRADALAETARACEAAGAGAVLARACDVRERAAVESAFDAFVRAHGPLHAAVANAGVGGANQAGPGDRFDELVATNLGGTYATLCAARARLAPGPEPRHLLAVGSILARIGVAGYTGYCASKAGVLGLVRALAVELAGENVQVNAVCPGWVETDMARAGLDAMAQGLGISREEARTRALLEVPRGRMSTPDEIAGVVAWLLSPDAAGVTGQAVDVNGGAFMH